MLNARPFFAVLTALVLLPVFVVSGAHAHGLLQNPTAASENAIPWQNLPITQQIRVRQVTFDEDGYQIQAENGQVILVPFGNQNERLYPMRFARSSTGFSYLINEGTDPVLFLTREAFLSYAEIPDTRWYPFPEEFTYTEPIYVSFVGAWNDYQEMGWYPGVVVVGGHYRLSHPNAQWVWMPRYRIHVGDLACRGYKEYRAYCVGHPGSVRMGRGIHRFAHIPVAARAVTAPLSRAPRFPERIVTHVDAPVRPVAGRREIVRQPVPHRDHIAAVPRVPPVKRLPRVQPLRPHPAAPVVHRRIGGPPIAPIMAPRKVH